MLCTRCTRSHAVKSDRSFQYKMKPDSHNAQQSRIARHAPPTLPALKACRRTEEAPCWVTTGVAHVDAGHHTCRSHARPTAQGRLRATPCPSGSAVCMHTSDASELQTRNVLRRALTDANFTLSRARAARRARPTSWAVRASHKNTGVSADFFPQFAAPKPKALHPFLNVFLGVCPNRSHNKPVGPYGIALW